RTISTDAGSAGMESRRKRIPAVGPTVGTSPRRSFRIANQQQTTSVHGVEAPSIGAGLRCYEARLVAAGQPVHLPTMESPTQHSPETQKRKARGDDHRVVAAISDLVSHPSGDGDRERNLSPKIVSRSTARVSGERARAESALESIGMASKRRRLEIAGLSEQALSLILANKRIIRTQGMYAPTQKEFITWLERGRFPEGFNAEVPIINWLCLIQAQRGLAWSTVLGKKSALLALFETPDIIRKGPVFKVFLASVKGMSVLDTKHVTFNIEP
ncbi:hypothetical protein EDD11_000735, partial [Mortierella claussenii]